MESTTARSGWSLPSKPWTTAVAFTSTYSNGMLRNFRTAYPNPVVSAAIENRIAYLKGKADRLYELSVYFVVSSNLARRAALRGLARGGAGSGGAAGRSWLALLSTRKAGSSIARRRDLRAQAALRQKVEASSSRSMTVACRVAGQTRPFESSSGS